MEGINDFNNLSDTIENEFDPLADDDSVDIPIEDKLLFGDIDEDDDSENDDDSIIEDSYDDEYDF